MAVNNIKKIYIYGHKSVQEALLNALLKAGVVEIHEVELPTATTTSQEERQEELTGQLSELEFAIDFLDKLQPVGGLLASLKQGKPLFSRAEEERILREFDAAGFVAQVRQDARKLTELQNRQAALAERRVFLQPWQAALGDTPVGQIKSTQRVFITAATLPLPQLEQARAVVQAHDQSAHLEIVGHDKQHHFVVLFVLREHSETVLHDLKELGLEEVNLGEEQQNVAALLTSLDQEIKALEHQRVEICQHYRQQVENKFYLMLTYDHLANELAKKQAGRKFHNTQATFILQGWMPTKAEEAITKALAQFEHVDWQVTEPEEGEEPPVLLENKKLVAPFEVITDLYSIPQYREIDPTPWLAPFFALYFGICLTDAGYGLVILLTALLLMKMLKPVGNTKKLLTVLFIGGCFTVVVGALTGGFFGIDFNQLPSSLGFLKKARDSITLVDPMKDQMLFFAIALCLGFFQVALGFGIKAYCQIKAGRWRDAIYDQFSWHLLMIGGLLFILASFLKVIPGFWGRLGGYIFCAGAVLVILFAGREQKNPFLRLGSGLYALYGISGVLGDVLSFSRLLALGLATGVIAGVVNTIAAMLLQVPYGIGVVLMVLVLVVGHIFNIAINALGAFVHSIRLQFVEFFTKFYEGGGNRFQPLDVQRKYTVIKEEIALHSQK